ncbi:hypothetical protein [Runella sp.]|uniref:hypothetical protein n=1 Tax=Runella sp. TaxID=1960881 RepID=UPI00301A9822
MELKTLDWGLPFKSIAMSKVNPNIEVKDLTLFEDNFILFYKPAQRLYAFPKKEHLLLLKENKVRSIWALPDEEIECYPLTADRLGIEAYAITLKISALQEVGYIASTYQPNQVRFILY